jgi:hypothetical protein
MRLEQGRDRNPSEQVLDSLARALRLDGDAAVYLRNVAGGGSSRDVGRRAPVRGVDPALQALIDAWSMTPAHIFNRRVITVTAANALACALSPLFQPGVNVLRAIFFDPRMRELYRNWDEVTARTAPYLRSLLGVDGADPEVVSLIDDLSGHSERFRQVWARHEVKRNPRGLMLIHHPQVGDLDLHYQQMPMPNTGNLLVVYWADTGSVSARRLADLTAG